MFTASAPRMYARFHCSSSFRSFAKRSFSSKSPKSKRAATAAAASSAAGAAAATNAMWRLRTSTLSSSPSSILLRSSLPSLRLSAPPLSVLSSSALSSAANALVGMRPSGLVMDAQSLLLCGEEDDDGRLTGRRAFSTLSSSATAGATAVTAATSTPDVSASSPVAAAVNKRFPSPSSSSFSSSSFSDILDPSNPPLLALTHYQLLLSHLFNDRLVVREYEQEKRRAADQFAAEKEARDAFAAPLETPGASVKLAMELMERGGEKVRDSVDFLNRLSDEELMDAMAARSLEHEEIDAPSRPSPKQSRSYMDVMLSDERFFHPAALKSGENFEHLKRVSAYAFLMRRRLGAALGLSSQDVERIADSGRLSKNLFRIVEHELTPSSWRYIGLVNSSEVDITSLGTLGSTAALAKLSANNEWQSAYYPRRLTSRANRHKYCRLCIGESNRDPRFALSFLNVELLHQFINTRGKIIGRRFTRVCAKHQRKLNSEIKRARNLGLIAWLSDWKVPDEFVQEFYGGRKELKRILEEVAEQGDEEKAEKERKTQHLGISAIDLGKPRPNIADELGVDVERLRQRRKKRDEKELSDENKVVKRLDAAVAELETMLPGAAGARARAAARAPGGLDSELDAVDSRLGQALMQDHVDRIMAKDEEMREMTKEFDDVLEKLKADALDPVAAAAAVADPDADPFAAAAETRGLEHATDLERLQALVRYRAAKGIEDEDFDEKADAEAAAAEPAALHADALGAEGAADADADADAEDAPPTLDALSSIPLRTRESVLYTGHKPLSLTDRAALPAAERERREISARRRKFRREHLLIGRVRQKALKESLADEERERTLERLDEIYQIKGFEREKRRTAYTSMKDVVSPDEMLEVEPSKGRNRADVEYMGQEFEKNAERVRKEDQKAGTETEAAGKKKKK